MFFYSYHGFLLFQIAKIFLSHHSLFMSSYINTCYYIIGILIIIAILLSLNFFLIWKTTASMVNQSVVIKSSHSDLVLDGSDTEVKLQRFTGCASQLWTFEVAGLGRQYIVNKGNGKVVDLQGGIIENTKIIMHEKHDGLNQKWFINSDNTIVSFTGNLAVDVNLANYVPGAEIIAHSKHLGDNQKFYFENV